MSPSWRGVLEVLRVLIPDALFILVNLLSQRRMRGAGDRSGAKPARGILIFFNTTTRYHSILTDVFNTIHSDCRTNY